MVKRLYSILSMLAVQFVLGMGLNLVGEPKASAALGLKLAAWVLLTLHIFVAIGLAVAAIQIWRMSHDEPETAVWAQRGGGAVALAFVSGIFTTVTPFRGLFSFIMALGFMLAFIGYGMALMRLISTSRAAAQSKTNG